MKKTVLALLLAASILGATACNSKTQTVTQRPTDGSDTPFVSTTSEIAPETVETVNPEKDEIAKIENLTQRPKNQYDIDIHFNEESKSIDVEQKLTYVNNTGDDLEEIYFNMIPEAFSKKKGGVDVESVKIGTEDLKFKKVDGTVYALALPTKLEKGKMVTIDMKYTVKIPENADRFGYYKDTYNLGNALITPAIYEDGQWLKQPYIDLGDAFYTEIADYRVSINAPKDYLIASTGTLINDVYVAENVRDFAFTITKDMDILCEEYEDIALNVFYPKANPNVGKHVMDVAKKSLSLFNEKLGKYPYDTLNMVCTAMPGGIGGMEYPGLIMMTVEEDIESALDLYNGTITVEEYLKKLDDEYGNDKPEKLSDIESSVPTVSPDETKKAILYVVDSLTHSTAHEIAHQWFYGIVGNNEVRHPWIDEGMCRFLEGYYSNYYKDGDDYTFSIFELLKNMDEAIYDEAKSNDNEQHTVDLTRSLYDFKNDKESYGEIYYKSAAMIFHMYEKLGDEAFISALKEYVQKFAYSEVTPEEFRTFWSGKGDFSELFDIYLKKSE